MYLVKIINALQICSEELYTVSIYLFHSQWCRNLYVFANETENSLFFLRVVSWSTTCITILFWFLFPKAKDSLEVKTEDATYFYKYFHFTTISEKEVEHTMNYLMEIHINNSTVGGGNAAEEQLNHSCLVAMMEYQNDCINISLQLKSYMECKLQRRVRMEIKLETI